MKNLFWVLSAFFLSTSFGFAADAPETAAAKAAAEGAIASMTQAKSVGDLLSLSKPRLKEEDFKYISARSAELLKEPVEIRRSGPFKITVRERHTEVEFEIVDPVRKIYSINHQRYHYSSTKPISQIWREIAELLPSQISSNWTDLLIPSAHAVGAGALLVAGAVLVVDAVITCSTYSFYANQCLQSPDKIWPEKVNTAVGVARHWETFCPLPGRKKKLLECLRDKVNKDFSVQQKSQLDPAVRQLLGVDMSAPQPAEGAAAGDAK